jgi:protoporphyrinogen oxidase
MLSGCLPLIRKTESVAVVGAGPAGLAAAFRLQELGVAVTVFEASDAVGGMARTIGLWGQKVDLGPHRFFSNDPRVNGLWRDVLGEGGYAMVSRLTRIYYDGTFFDYPLKAANAVRGLGVLKSFLCICSYLKACIGSGDGGPSFESWVSRRFGRRLYEMFFKSYSEKL